LINAVLKRKNIARVSQTPGKTQAIQFYLINESFYLVDLPGYGYAKVPKSVLRTWGALIRGYLETASGLRLLFLLLDARRTPGDHDLQMVDWASESDVDALVLLTKSDKLSNQQLIKQRQVIAGEVGVDAEHLIPVSAVTNRGIEEVRREITSRLRGTQ
jgi:GTP-binding protein